MMKRALPAFLLAIAVVSPRRMPTQTAMRSNSAVTFTSPPARRLTTPCVSFAASAPTAKVNGDIVVFFGDVELNGEAHHDVVNFFGKTRPRTTPPLAATWLNFFGSVRLGENVTVGKDLVAFFGSLDAPSSVSVGGDRVVQPAWVIALPPLVFILVILVIVYELPLLPQASVPRRLSRSPSAVAGSSANRRDAVR